MSELPENIGDVEVAVKHVLTGEHVKIQRSLGNTLSELVSNWGEDVVTSNAIIGIKTQLRNKLYSMIGSGSFSDEEDAKKNCPTAEQALAELEDWTPSIQISGQRKDQKEKVLESFKKMDPETRKALMAQLQSQLEG